MCRCGVAIDICKGDTDTVHGSLLNSICSRLPLASTIIRGDEKINGTSLVKASIGCWGRWLCLPGLQPRPDDGFVELGNLPLQHRPQALPQAVVVLLQLPLVLRLVRRDQVLVLLNGLATPGGGRAERV